MSGSSLHGWAGGSWQNRRSPRGNSTSRRDGLKSGTVNGKLVSLDSYLLFIGRGDCKVRLLKIQRRTFRDEERELGVGEYRRLLDTAECLGKTRLHLLVETLAATGIRISELAYITVEALQKGRAEISLKGKVRVILLPRALVKKLREYAKENAIPSGCVFRTRSGRPLGRKQAWSEIVCCEKQHCAANQIGEIMQAYKSSKI